VHFPYAIGEEYIAATPERIAAYRRILEARRSEELEALRSELQDRYGQPPAGMEKIFYVGAVKLFARLYGWVRADVHPDRVLLDAGRELEPPARPLPGVQLFEGGNLELEFHGLDDFLTLGKRLKRLFA